jgi:predicted O-methyltransferase YrrM
MATWCPSRRLRCWSFFYEPTEPRFCVRTVALVLASHYIDGRCVMAKVLRLMSVDAFRINEIFKSPSSDKEWPTVAERIDGILQIEDGTGGVNPGDRRALYYLTRWLRPERVLEIGTHVGASTLHIAAALHDNAENGSLTTVDVEDVNADNGAWQKAGLSKTPAIATAALGVSVNFVRADSIDFLTHVSVDFDLVFLDGDHAFERALAEIPLALKCLRKNGVILLHDYFPHGINYWKEEVAIEGPYAAVRRLQESGVAFVPVPFGVLPWATKRGTCLTSLAALLSHSSNPDLAANGYHR